MSRKKYIYTDKRTSLRAMLSVILGIVGSVSVLTAIYLSYVRDGKTTQNYGFAVLFAAFFAFMGLCLGFATVQHREYYKVLPVLGILLNLVTLGLVAVIFYFSGALG